MAMAWIETTLLIMVELCLVGLVQRTEHIGQFAQFGLNKFKRGQKCFSQLQLYLDTDKLQFCVQFNHFKAGVSYGYMSGLWSL